MKGLPFETGLRKGEAVLPARRPSAEAVPCRTEVNPLHIGPTGTCLAVRTRRPLWRFLGRPAEYQSEGPIPVALLGSSATRRGTRRGSRWRGHVTAGVGRQASDGRRRTAGVGR